MDLLNSFFKFIKYLFSNAILSSIKYVKFTKAFLTLIICKNTSENISLKTTLNVEMFNMWGDQVGKHPNTYLLYILYAVERTSRCFAQKQ